MHKLPLLASHALRRFFLFSQEVANFIPPPKPFAALAKVCKPVMHFAFVLLATRKAALDSEFFWIPYLQRKHSFVNGLRFDMSYLHKFVTSANDVNRSRTAKFEFSPTIADPYRALE